MLQQLQDANPGLLAGGKVLPFGDYYLQIVPADFYLADLIVLSQLYDLADLQFLNLRRVWPKELDQEEYSNADE